MGALYLISGMISGMGSIVPDTAVEFLFSFSVQGVWDSDRVEGAHLDFYRVQTGL